MALGFLAFYENDDGVLPLEITVRFVPNTPLLLRSFKNKTLHALDPNRTEYWLMLWSGEKFNTGILQNISQFHDRQNFLAELFGLLPKFPFSLILFPDHMYVP